MRIYLLTLVAATCAIIITTSPSQAQTRTPKGIRATQNSVGNVVPEAWNLVSMVDGLSSIQTKTQSCAQDGKLFDPNTETCRAAPAPVDIQFTNGGNTQLRIQRPDGSFATYNLDGADGYAVVVP